jgi:hypothetical protein
MFSFLFTQPAVRKTYHSHGSKAVEFLDTLGRSLVDFESQVDADIWWQKNECEKQSAQHRDLSVT